jgi:uncharacterized membrane protein YjdF
MRSKRVRSRRVSVTAAPAGETPLAALVLMLGMAIGAAWEIVEWTLDSTTGSNLATSVTDTATDLIWDTIGSAGAATILVLWSLGNHSLRRRSGAELADKPFGSFLAVSTR